MTDLENKTLLAARSYIKSGLRVFPLNGKVPVTANGCDDASTDAAQIETWFPRVRNIAIVTPPGVVVVDMDPRNGGDKTISRWCADYGVEWLAGVPRARTGGGGLHYWFKYGGEPLRKSINGVDFQRGNKYVVAPPSHTVGDYEWEIGLPTDLENLPELPDWLLELARRPAPEPKADPDRVYESEDALDTAVHGFSSFGDVLTRHGWTLVSGGGDEDGSKWRHPNSENESSATVKYGCLFVYTDNTPFPVTEDGDPHGVTLYSALQTLDHAGDASALTQQLRDHGYLPPALPWCEDLGSLVGSSPEVVRVSDEPESDLRLGTPLDWPEAFAADDDIEQRWLVEPIIAIGRAHALFAGAKTGKSLLLLALAAALASGRAFLDMPVHDPVPVMYLDYEMTRDDVVERLRTFGYEPEDLGLLHYFLLGSGNGLDSAAGGLAVAHDAMALGVGLVVVDTTARAVAGAENEADTFRAFYRFTGAPLKRLGVSVIRLDHGGKDETKGQRGSSAKNDDVDVVWKLSAKDDGAFDLEATHQRMGWVDRKVGLSFDEDERTGISAWSRRHVSESWSPGVAEAAAVLRRLGAPSNVSVRAAKALLREGGWTGKNEVAEQAVRFHKMTRPSDLTHVEMPVDNPADDGVANRGTRQGTEAENLLRGRFGDVRGTDE